VNIRAVTEEDAAVVRPLWEAFEAEIPPPPSFEESWEEAWGDLSVHARDGAAFLAEDGEEAVGFAFATKPEKGRSHLTDVYVRQGARRRGIARALVAEVAGRVRELGAEQLSLDVLTANAAATTVWQRLGFAEMSRFLAAPLDTLDERLASAPAGPSFGSVHVQTDDLTAVERAVRQFVPRLPGRSEGTVVSPPRNGWIAVYDELCDRDPAMLRRLARELSDRMGAVVIALGVEDGAAVRYVLFERARIVDEYLSVPEFHGPLPPGDVVGLAANPTAVARLTGADPASVRAIARTATAPGDLPPAPELLAELGATLRLEGAEHGYADANEVSGGIAISRGQSPPA
jgi:ribosomal protein S18 acetylase RimI-like enzyme